MRWLLLVSLLAATAAHADPIDDVIEAELAKRRIPGLSLVVFENGRSVKVKAYGVIKAGEATPVTPKTLFQAGSISKAVAAVGALNLVERKRLSLDENVNDRLTSWKLPENALTTNEPVTLRRILSHSAGLTVHGFPGYPAGGPLPSLIQVLDGQPPANTAPIRVDLLPGSRWRYSGGGFTVMQQLVIDVTGQPYPRFMQKAVLGPAKMTDSTYEQPLPQAKAAQTAFGHTVNRRPVPSRFHVYPEMAAAGLWTTATDLARFGIELHRALTGKSRKLLSQAMAHELATPQKEPSGLGLFLRGNGKTLRLQHGGRDEGFDAYWFVYAETGQGVALLINTNENGLAIERIVEAIRRAYGWPDATPLPTIARVPIDPALLASVAGRYELANSQTLALAVSGDRLFTVADGLPDDELVPVSQRRFISTSGLLELELVHEKGEVVALSWKRGASSGKAPRIAPLAASRTPQADPAPELTQKVLAALQALGRGKAGAPELALARKLREALSGPLPELAQLTSLRFVSAHDVAGRGLERYEEKISRVLVYERVPTTQPRYLLVHLSADGLIADFDFIDE